MWAVCSGTGGIGGCGWSDMAKPPAITAPTPLSTFRPTHSPTVSVQTWDILDLEHLGKPAQRPIGAVVQNDENRRYSMLGCRPKARDGEIRRPIADQPDDAPVRAGKLDAECDRNAEAETACCREVVAARLLHGQAFPQHAGRRR